MNALHQMTFSLLNACVAIESCPQSLSTLGRRARHYLLRQSKCPCLLTIFDAADALEFTREPSSCLGFANEPTQTPSAITQLRSVATRLHDEARVQNSLPVPQH